MKVRKPNFKFLLYVLIASSCSGGQPPAPGPQPCSEKWQEHVEAKLRTGDSEGHGPDVGSLEWRSVVEFKLGIRGDPEIPTRESDQWCTNIDEIIRTSADYPIAALAELNDRSWP